MTLKSWITDAPIDPESVLDLVRDRSAGGTVLFLGTVRNRSEGGVVTGLEYDVYKQMAERKMIQIEGRVKEKWPVKKIVMVHRYGRLEVGDISVAVAVSSEHRAEAFEACRYAIDTIKRTLPFWKKERFKGRRPQWEKGRPIVK